MRHSLGHRITYGASPTSDVLRPLAVLSADITPDVEFKGTRSVVPVIFKGFKILFSRADSNDVPVIFSITYPRIWKAAFEYIGVVLGKKIGAL